MWRVEDLAQSLGKFDVVTFWATVEHVRDPIQTLKTIRALLVNGGCVLLDTGIADDWLDRLLPGVVQWYDPPQHLWVFSARGIELILKAAGFSRTSIDRCFERSSLRRLIRQVRGALASGSLRLVAEAMRLHSGPIEFRRYPLGNLMSVQAFA